MPPSRRHPLRAPHLMRVGSHNLGQGNDVRGQLDLLRVNGLGTARCTGNTAFVSASCDMRQNTTDYLARHGLRRAPTVLTWRYAQARTLGLYDSAMTAWDPEGTTASGNLANSCPTNSTRLCEAKYAWQAKARLLVNRWLHERHIRNHAVTVRELEGRRRPQSRRSARSGRNGSVRKCAKTLPTSWAEAHTWSCTSMPLVMRKFITSLTSSSKRHRDVPLLDARKQSERRDDVP
jgi:hypothetical protein